jgi:hypothetical protein
MAEPRLSEFPGWRAGWQKPDRRPMYAWAADQLTLPASYRIPGKFDVTVRRPLMAVFDAIQDTMVRRVHFRKPPRFGGSLINDIAIPWIVCNDPGPIMWNWQKDDAGNEHMKEKAWPLWRSSEKFRAMLPEGRHDITTTEIYFGPFFLKVQGANPNNFQGKGIRWQFNEEIWLPVWQTLYNQAVSRTRDFAEIQSEKITNVSQAGNAGDVEARSYDAGHQAVWGYKAPDGRHYPLLMGGKRPDGTRWGLMWSDDAKRADGTYSRARAIETARYVCKETGHVWLGSAETLAEWNRDGAYLPQNPGAPAEVRSFAVNALLNNSFADLVTRKIAALEQASYGDMTGMRDVKQQDECLPWEETYLTVTIDGTAAGYKVEAYANGEVLDGEKYRTLMADRQAGVGGDSPHRWCELRAWRSDGSSRQLFYGRVGTKEEMRDLQQRYNVPDRCVWQDAAYEKHEVYKECAEYGWIAVFGSDQPSWPHVLPPLQGSSEPRKLRLPYSPWQRTTALGKTVIYLHFSEDYMADILANLAAGRGVGYEHPDDVPPAYLEQMKGEHKVQKKGRWVWEKIHSTKPNHGFDTGKQGVCFALLMKLLAMPKKAQDDKPSG